MKKLTLAASLFMVPAVAQAQSGAQAQSQTKVSAGAWQSSKSTEAQGSVEATLRVARERGLPEEPIRRRAAEGRAKGASEAQIVAASNRTLVDLQSSSDAMVRGGHSTPSDDEVARGAQLMARGYTSAQIEAVAKQSAPERSLVVAFETLTSLRARGATTATAVAQVEGLLAAHASDKQLRELAVSGTAATDVVGGVNAGNARGNAAGSASGSAAAGVGSAAAGVTAGAAAGVKGAVGGVLGKKP